MIMEQLLMAARTLRQYVDFQPKKPLISKTEFRAHESPQKGRKEEGGG